MSTGKLLSFAFAFAGVIASVYLYNRFLAPAGKSVADLGRKA